MASFSRSTPRRITAWDSLFPYFKDSAQIRVDDKVYMVPAFGGTTGLIYNPDKVPGGVTSFQQLLEDPALKGKVAIEDNPKYGIAMAALALGFKDPYDLTDADLAQVKQWYIEHKSQIRAFYSDESDFFDLYQERRRRRGLRLQGVRRRPRQAGRIGHVRPCVGGRPHLDMRILDRSERPNLDGAYSLLDWFLDPGGPSRVRDEVEPDGHESRRRSTRCRNR